MLRARWFTTWGIAGKTFVFPALTMALVLVIAIGSRAASAESDDLTLTVQVGNTGPQLSTVDVSCAEVSVGQVFPVDVRVENVSDLRVFELRVTYDSSVLSLEEADFDHFLVSTPPHGQIFPSFFLEETADSYFLAAADQKGSADSGSGVLARLQMRAISEGMSEIGIQTEPTVYGPRLQNAKGQFIGDDTGDRVFDGTVLNGMAAVNANCSPGGEEDPPVSDGGDPGHGGDPGPGSDPDDGADSSDDGPTDGSAGEGSEDGDPTTSGDAGDGSAGEGGQEGDPADSADAGDGSAGSGADTEGSDVAATNEGPDSDDGDLGGPGSTGGASKGGSGLSLLWYTLIVVGAAAVLAVLGLALKSVRAS